jgi:hypothetical protein
VEASVPTWREIWAALDELAPTVLVGGAARAELRGDPMPADIDLATALTPDEVMRRFPGARPTGLRYGTVTLVAEDARVDVTSFRTEAAYADGRRPEDVRFGVDLTADLARRDFTIGAFAVRRDGAVIDPFGGVADLRAGRLRTVGEPAERFAEDWLRPLRAARFVAELDLRPDRLLVETAEAVAERVAAVAAARRWQEVRRILVGPAADRAWATFPEVLARAAPFLGPQPVGDLPPALAPRLLRKARPDAAAGLARMGAGGLADLVARAQRLPLRGPAPVLRRALAEAGREAAQLAALVRDGELAALLAAEGVLDRSALAVGANDLLALAGERPGPWVGELLAELLAAVWADPSVNSRERLMGRARAWLDERRGGGRSSL